MTSLIHIQIIIEVVLFGVVMFLLWRLKREVSRYRPLADGSVMGYLKKTMTDTQEFAKGFLAQMEENKDALNKLARQLDEKERRLTHLLEKAEAAIKKLDAGRNESEKGTSIKRYDQVMELVRRGMDPEEVSRQSGLSEDEVKLIAELVKVRKGQPS